jgi:hypothetical protein
MGVGGRPGRVVVALSMGAMLYIHVANIMSLSNSRTPHLGGCCCSPASSGIHVGINTFEEKLLVHNLSLIVLMVRWMID